MALYMADSFTAGRYRRKPEEHSHRLRAKQLPSYAGSASQAAEDLASYLQRGLSVVVLAGDMRRARSCWRIPRRARHKVLRHGAALGNPARGRLRHNHRRALGRARIPRHPPRRADRHADSRRAASKSAGRPPGRNSARRAHRLLRRPRRRRPRRPRAPRHRPLRRRRAHAGRRRREGLHKDFLRRERHALRPRDAARPRQQVHRRGRGPARQALEDGRHGVAAHKITC